MLAFTNDPPRSRQGTNDSNQTDARTQYTLCRVATRWDWFRRTAGLDRSGRSGVEVFHQSLAHRLRPQRTPNCLKKNPPLRGLQRFPANHSRTKQRPRDARSALEHPVRSLTTIPRRVPFLEPDQFEAFVGVLVVVVPLAQITEVRDHQQTTVEEGLRSHILC